jgi:hypothetical protein
MEVKKRGVAIFAKACFGHPTGNAIFSNNKRWVLSNVRAMTKAYPNSWFIVTIQLIHWKSWNSTNWRCWRSPSLNIWSPSMYPSVFFIRGAVGQDEEKAFRKWFRNIGELRSLFSSAAVSCQSWTFFVCIFWGGGGRRRIGTIFIWTLDFFSLIKIIPQTQPRRYEIESGIMPPKNTHKESPRLAWDNDPHDRILGLWNIFYIY